MPRLRPGLVGCIVLAFVVLALTAGLGLASGAGQPSADDGAVFAAQDVDPDRVLLRAMVDETGDAHWTVEYRVRLDSDEREAAFADLEDDVRENESAHADRLRDRMATTAETAAETTGREMAVSTVTASTSRESFPEEYGVVTYEFTWTEFAAADGDELVMGDALAGLYLEEGYSLRLGWPDGHELESAHPSPDDRDDTWASWRGPTDFATDEPRVTVSDPGALGVGGPLVAGTFAALVVLAFVYRRGGIEAALDTIGTNGGGSPNGPGPTATDPTVADGASDAAGRVEPETTEPDAETTESASSAAETERGEPPEELLSNEERVLRLLRRHGGRMKQQDVVRELGWTDARTSQVVSGLREEGELESFRLGRENVLRLPEADEIGGDLGAPGENGDES